jgi:very-short-patch-repair endonuclease
MNNMQQTMKLTACERLGYAMLDSLSLRHIRQHMVCGKFCVDAYLPDHNVVVQFDGDYWHGNPAKYSDLDARQQKRVQYDRSQDAFMLANGIRVFRFWHSELHNDSDAIKHRFRRLLVLP